MEKTNFYSVIIGTELLNGRRKDAHFSFLNSELLKRDLEHKASFVIEDDPKLMQEVFNLVKKERRRRRKKLYNVLLWWYWLNS